MGLKVNIPIPKTRTGRIALVDAFGFAGLVAFDGYHADNDYAAGQDGWQYTIDVAKELMVNVGLRPDISKCHPPQKFHSFGIFL